MTYVQLKLTKKKSSFYPKKIQVQETENGLLSRGISKRNRIPWDKYLQRQLNNQNEHK